MGWGWGARCTRRVARDQHRDRERRGVPPQQGVEVVGDHVQVLGEHRVAAGDPEVDARLVDEGAVADRARDLEEALEVVDGVGEVALLLVDNRHIVESLADAHMLLAHARNVNVQRLLVVLQRLRVVALLPVDNRHTDNTHATDNTGPRPSNNRVVG